MSDNITIISSDTITKTVSELCRYANIYVYKDLYDSILQAYNKETAESAKDILGQLLQNIELAAKKQRPICQDTGMAVVFAELGQNIVIKGENIELAINKGVENAYKENYFRKSVVDDAVFERKNTGTNTPAVIHYEMIPGDSVKITVAPKGFGSENMSAIAMLKPAVGEEGLKQFVIESIKKAGSNPCPPIKIGIGIGGTFEKAALLSKKALLKPIKSETELVKNQETDCFAKLELELTREINGLKIGAAGLGGDTTLLGVSVLGYPTHIASMPVAVNVCCHAARHATAIITGEEVDFLLDELKTDFHNGVDTKLEGLKVNADDAELIKKLKKGEKVLLTGEIYTGRDAAHRKLVERINNDEPLPFELKDKLIYYVGPCPSVNGEIIGPAGPTTACRMDKYAPVLMDKGLLGSIGKGMRSLEVIQSIKKNKAIYFIATGGAASLLAEKISSCELIAYPELGPEAIYKINVIDFPLIVAIDSNGDSIY